MGLNFFQKNKRVIVAVALVAVVFGTTVGPIGIKPAFAKIPIWLWGSIPAQIYDVGKRILTGEPTSIEGIADATACVASAINFANCIAGALGYLIEDAVLPFANKILTFTGWLLDTSIDYALDTSWFKSITAIDEGWRLIRDLVNMGFIFIMLYIAISTILQQSSYNIRSMLVKLIIAAVFINFSLFITKVVMDAGNVVARNFYVAITHYGSTDPNLPPTSTARQIILLSNLDPTFKREGAEMLTGDSLAASMTGSKLLINQTLRLLLICVAIYVFFKTLFLFVARIISFIFLMLFSPIGFIGAVFPGASGAAAKWRKMLIDQTLVAPVFLIILYLAIKIMAMLNIPTTNGTLAPVSYYFNYIIVMSLLLTALKITKDLGGEMGKMVESFGKKALAVAAGATIAIASGGSSALIRGGIAAAGSAVAGAKNAPAGSGLKGKIAGGYTAMKQDFSAYSRQKGEQKKAEIAKAFKEGSYDIRRAKIPFIKGPTLGEAAKTYMGVDVGKPMSPVERAREKEKFEKERKEDVARKQFDKDKADLQVAVNANDNRTIVAILQGGTDSRGATHSGMIDKKVTDLPEEILKKVGSQMKGSQFEAIMKGDFEQEAKGAISQNRNAKILDAINGGTAADLKTAVQDLKMKPADIAKLKSDWLKSDKFVAIMNTQMLPKIMEEIQPSDFDEIKDRIVARASSVAATSDDKAMEKWLKTNSLI